MTARCPVEAKPARRFEERASLCRRYEATASRGVVRDRTPRRTWPDLRCRAGRAGRRSPASSSRAPGIRSSRARSSRDDLRRAPSARRRSLPTSHAPRDCEVASDLAGESILPADRLGDLESVRRCIARYRRAVVNTQVLREAGRHDSGVHFREFPCCDIGAGLRQYLEPHAEPIGVELARPVPAWPHARDPGRRRAPVVRASPARRTRCCLRARTAGSRDGSTQAGVAGRRERGVACSGCDRAGPVVQLDESQIESFGHVEWTTMPRTGADR